MKYGKYGRKALYIIGAILIIIFLYSIYTTKYSIEPFENKDIIPHIIWQTYKNKELPPQAARLRKSWIDKNPGWTVELYEDDHIDKYIKGNWDNDMYAFFKALPLGVMKADLWRYLILTTHGGVYTDVDSICLLPASQWFNEFSTKDALVISPEKGGEIHFCQWTIYCSKEHPAMRYISKFILNNYKDNRIDVSSQHFVHETTGPSIWTKAIQSYLQINDKTAEQLFEMYKKDNKPFIDKGIYILSADHFQGKYSENVYGSLFFKDGYVNWTDQRDAMVKNANK